MRSPIKSWRLTFSISCLIVLGMVISSTSLLFVVHRKLTSEGEAAATGRQLSSLRISATILEPAVSGMSIKWSPTGEVERVVVDQMPEFKDHALIDRVSRITGEPATVFVYDAAQDDFVRRTTSVKKPDGSRAVGTVLGKASAANAPVRRGEMYLGEAKIFDVPYYTIYLPVFDKSNKVVGILFAGVKQSDVFASANSLSIDITLISVVLVALMAVGGVFMARTIARPISDLAGLTARIAKDETTGEVPYRDWGNEIGDLAKSVAVLQSFASERSRLHGEQERQQAARESRQKSVEQLISGFERDVATVVSTVSGHAAKLEATAESLTKVAGTTTSRATSVAAASDQATANVTTVAAAAEELSRSISEISSQIVLTSSNMGKAAEAAESTNRKVAGLAAAAGKIGEVVTLITQIASQTNLLALNATIEAARAGEAGRGFAVVASEVKTLAAQTEKATETIGTLVNEMQVSTNEAVASIEAIARTMSDVNGMTTSMAAAVEQQGAATNEISDNVQQAAQGTRHVSETIGGLTRAADEASTSASSVLTASREVGETARMLKLRIDQFLKAVSAA